MPTFTQVCSDINKPNGQFVLPNERVAVVTFISSLPIRKVPLYLFVIILLKVETYVSSFQVSICRLGALVRLLKIFWKEFLELQHVRKCCRKVVSSVHYFLTHLQVCTLFLVTLWVCVRIPLVLVILPSLVWRILRCSSTS